MSESNLNERLSFYALAKGRTGGFGGVARALKKHLGGGLDRFYSAISQRDNLSDFFNDAKHMAQAKELQAKHWISVFENGVDQTFIDRATHIGQTHARIGLEPKWYVGGYALILEDVIMGIIAPGWQRYLPWKRAEAQKIVALIKVSLLDIDLALTSYFVDSEANSRRVSEELGGALSALSKGKLTAQLENFPKEFRKIEEDFNNTVGSLNSTIGTVIAGVEAMTIGSSEIRSASSDLAARTEQQAASLEKTAAAIGQTTKEVQETAETTSKARQTITETTENAAQGAAIVSEAVTAMDQIEQSSREINDIIAVIDSIAFQTNLLALNAGVEAARAGETGKGFAVVASEVRALSQRCAEAADEVKSLISVSGKHVSSGVELVSKSGEAFASIREGVNELSEAVSHIAESTSVQANSLSQINSTVGDLDRSTQQNAAMAQECTAAAASLAGEAGTLGQSVQVFEVNKDAADAQLHGRPRLAA